MDQEECPVRKTAIFPSLTSIAPPSATASVKCNSSRSESPRERSSLHQPIPNSYLSTRCRNGKEGSVYSGGGLLTEAAGLAGYQPAFAIEINSDYAVVFEENHSRARMFNL